MADTALRSETVRAGRASRWWAPAPLFIVIGAVLFAVIWFSAEHLKLDDPPYPGAPSTKAVVGGWLQYDTGWYMDIASNGYSQLQVDAFKAGQQSSVAFFPAYPLTVRAVSHLTDDVGWAADIVTAVCGLAVALLFWRWCGDRLSPNARVTALLLLLLYPYAWFLYGSGYGDAMFIASALAAFLLLERDHVVLAGLVGALSTATRITGLAVVVGLIAVLLERRGALARSEHAATSEGRWWHRERSRWRFDRTKLRRGDAAVLLSLGGIVSYSLFLWNLVGDPIAFDTVQAAPGWDQGTGPNTWFKRSFFGQVLHENWAYSIRLVAQALLALLFLAAVLVVVRRLGWGYAAYVVALISLPLIGSSTFQGFGRYLLGAFPVFAVGGDLLATRGQQRWLVLGASAFALVMLSSLFARGFYLT